MPDFYQQEYAYPVDRRWVLSRVQEQGVVVGNKSVDNLVGCSLILESTKALSTPRNIHRITGGVIHTQRKLLTLCILMDFLIHIDTISMVVRFAL